MAIVISHVLSQRKGEKRADYVRVELAEKIDLLNHRITEVRDTLSDRINAELSSRTDAQFAPVRSELLQSAAGVKELVLAESRASRAEIMAALSARSRSAGADR